MEKFVGPPEAFPEMDAARDQPALSGGWGLAGGRHKAVGAEPGKWRYSISLCIPSRRLRVVEEFKGFCSRHPADRNRLVHQLLKPKILRQRTPYSCPNKCYASGIAPPFARRRIRDCEGG